MSECIGKYRIIRRLGAGGQATTWLAEDPDTQNEVLLKVFHVELAEDWKIAELFERSARVLEAVDHPNVPAYHDHFEVEDGHTIKLCLVREFVDGDSLQDVIDDGGSFSESEVVELAVELLEVLEYLHSMDPPVIHRDIKPANIILGADDRPYLVDFGAVQAEVMSETGGSTVVGTAGYVAPEQLMGRAQPSSDLYALGITLVHLLTRKAPTELPSKGFELDFSAELHSSPELKYVIGRMTRADIDEREDSAAGLLEKFRTLSDGGELVVRSSTLPVKVPAGSRLEVVETHDSVIVRTPPVLAWNSSPWKRWVKMAALVGPALPFVFLLFVVGMQSPALAVVSIACLLVVTLLLRRQVQPLEIQLGPHSLKISQPLIRQGRHGVFVDNGQEWISYLSRRNVDVVYEHIESVDFASLPYGGMGNSLRVMRLNCTPKISLESAPSHVLNARLSDSYLMSLGLTQGEEIWLARLINARVAQHREMNS